MVLLSRNIRTIYRLTMMDIKQRYIGTFLGGAWAILSPLVTICLIYFVFTFGLKAGTIGNMSFINWLVPGMLAWFYMSDVVNFGTAAIIDSSYLVTKVRFDVELLPVAKMLSPLLVHALLMSLFLALLAVEGHSQLCWFQLMYYLFCGAILCLGISYITSACAVFVRDTVNMVGVIIQVLFWATPIFWDPSMLSKTRFSWLLYNPFNYVVAGYRDSLFGGIWFWQKPVETTLFWLCCLFILFFGWGLFVRTRPHFADVL